MKFTIDALVLWPQNPSNARRVIPFKKASINIIHGLSGTGKSSIVHIVDYVLGATKCQIPIGLIRQQVQWFGLKITLRDETWLVARKTPGAKQTSSDYYLERMEEHYPTTVSTRLGIDAFKAKFNALVRMSDLPHSDTETPSALESRSSFRDLAAFNYLPQHIVANPNTLFFKTDSWLHRDRLIRAMPYALGIVDANYVITQRRRDAAEKERDSLEKELQVLNRAQLNWSSEVDLMLVRCTEVGLATELAIPETLDGKIEILRSIVAAYDKQCLENLLKEPDRLHANRVFDEAVRQEAVQQALVDELAAEVRGYAHLADSGQKFVQAISDERSHVIGLEWLARHVAPQGNCIACGSVTSELPGVIESLQDRVNAIATTAAILQDNPVIDKRLASLQRNITSEQRTLHRLRAQKNEILAQDQKLKDAIGHIYFLAGSIAGLLKRIGKTSVDGTIGERLKFLNDVIKECNRELLRSNKAQREREVDRELGELIEHYADLFPLEAPVNAEIKLDRKELTLRFDGNDEKKDYLWEVGSGANWMGYHLATFLALHEYIAQKANQELPVFGFLIIDQPSQVYFPSHRSGENALSQDFADLQKHRMSDIQSTRRIFEVLSTALERAHFNFQIIVLEHAGEDVWQQIRHTHAVEKWDIKGDGLIPADWV